MIVVLMGVPSWRTEVLVITPETLERVMNFSPAFSVV